MSMVLLLGAVAALAATRSELAGCGRVVGWVRDSCSGQPIDAANVVILGTRTGAFADREGGFVLRAPCGRQILRVAAFAYNSKLDTLFVDCTRTDTLRAALMPDRILRMDGDIVLAVHRDSCP